MIDWITAVVPCTHSERITGGKVLSVKSDGEIDWQVEKTTNLVGSYESSVRIKSQGYDSLFIDGNPAKWIQGHNLFGTDDLIGLMYEFLLRLSKQLSLSPTLDDLKRWKNGHYDLKRVDCTAMWSLPKRADVRSWIRAAELQSKSRHGRPITKHSTLYFGNGSRRWSLKFYSKGDELNSNQKGHSLPNELPNACELLSWADNKLRGELTLRSLQLKDLKLNNASNWQLETCQNLLISYIESLNMSDQFSLTVDELEDLPARLVAVYKLWKQGEDIRADYPKRTFYRYRSELLRHGIDIAIRQPPANQNVIPLVQVLRPEAIEQVPEFAKATPLYFNPVERKIA